MAVPRACYAPPRAPERFGSWTDRRARASRPQPPARYLPRESAVSGGTLERVEIVRVIRVDNSSERYLLEEQHEDGSLLLRPDTSLEAILERTGGRLATEEEFDAAFGDLPTGPA